MTRKTIYIAAGVLLAAGAVAAVAQQGPRSWRGGGGDMPGMEDSDGHRGGHGDLRGRWWRGGNLTQSEHEAQTRERFARLDRNSDGVIDAAEIEAVMAERMAGRHGKRGEGRKGEGRMGEGQMGGHFMQRFDTNHDGKVTRQEFSDAVRQRFAEVDLNNDGRIGDEDLPPMMRGRGVLAEGGGGHGHRGGHGGPMMGFLRGADTNKDGAIAQDEAMAQSAKEFARFDRNNDGVIDKADFDKMGQEMTDYRVRRFIHHFGGDKDGKVTREQFEKVARERFAMGDSNGDGTITRGERRGHGGWSGRGGDDRGPGERRGRGQMMGPDAMPGPGGGPGGAGPGPAPAPGGPGLGGPGRN